MHHEDGRMDGEADNNEKDVHHEKTSREASHPRQSLKDAQSRPPEIEKEGEKTGNRTGDVHQEDGRMEDDAPKAGKGQEHEKTSGVHDGSKTSGADENEAKVGQEHEAGTQ
jgi:hypothetical protein